MVLLLLISIGSNAQNKQPKVGLADSSSKLNRCLMEADTYMATNRYDSLRLSLEQAMSLAHYLKDDSSLVKIYGYFGIYFDNAGEYALALEMNFKALKLAEKLELGFEKASLNNNTAWLYAQSFDYNTSIFYCYKGIETLKKFISNNAERKRRIYTSLYSSLAISYFEIGKLDSAIYFNSLADSTAKNRKKYGIHRWIDILYGRIYQSVNEFEKADTFYRKAIYYPDSSDFLDALAYGIGKYTEFLLQQNKYAQAVSEGKFGLKVALGIDNGRTVIDIAENISKAYEKLGNIDSAYKYSQIGNASRKRIFNEKKTMELQNLSFSQRMRNSELEHEVSMARAEEVLKKQKLWRNVFMSGLAVVMLFATVFFLQRNKLAKEQTRSESLLLNILPAEIAKELKEKGAATPRDYGEVSILFTDFVRFTDISTKLSAKELVTELNECFKGFDLILDQYRIEKIKTIGDSYMAASGLPVATKDSVMNAVLAGISMQKFIEERKRANESLGKPYFEMRVGINTGPVVAGIVGVKKFQYDVWGDTVNIASRMESKGESGKVNISQSTYNLLKDDSQFSFFYRGKIEVKGKGELDMWFAQMA